MREKHIFLIRLFTIIFILFVARLIDPSNAHGVTTVSWVQTTQADFDEGTLDNISTHSTGVVTLSPRVEMVNGITEPYVWCMTMDVYGTMYIGTGEPGTIYKVPRTGSPFAIKAATRLYRSSEPHVHSIAVDSFGNVYAGTSPNGIIYKITPEGQTTIYCQLPVHYIWDMVFDSKDNLYAATGESGIIYKVANNGKATVLFDSPEAHILAIVIDEDDNLYCGSEPNGIIYKIRANGKVSALYDADESEIHCLALDKDGNLFAGTASGGQLRFLRPSPKASRYPEEDDYSFSDEERRTWVDKPLLSAERYNQHPQRHGYRYHEASSRIKGAPVGLNTVYKVTTEGDVEKIFEVQNAFIFCLAVDEHNDLYVGTGNEARIYKITRNEFRGNLRQNEDITTMLMDVQESQVLALRVCRSDGIYMATGNNGGVSRVSRHYTSEGTFTSSIHDTNFVSNWGRITWLSSLPGVTKLTLATRTGNSSNPDSTWSEWSEELATSGEGIKSPQARFIQYRARLTTNSQELSPALHEVSIAYLSNNQSPRISSIEVISKRGDRRTSELTRQRSRGSKTGRDEKNQDTRFNKQRSSYEHTIIKTIFWNADDPNNDRLSYKLYYKAIDERNWKSLAGELYNTDYYLWDTTRVPDGKYQIKIVASDEPDNPPGLAISTKKVCTPFVVDNTRPRVAELEVNVLNTKQCRVKGIARDDTCVISKIQYSLDTTNWVSIFPEDRIFDAEEETFQLLTPALTKGEHTIVINAFDNEGNVGSGKVVIEID